MSNLRQENLRLNVDSTILYTIRPKQWLLFIEDSDSNNLDIALVKVLSRLKGKELSYYLTSLQLVLYRVAAV